MTRHATAEYPYQTMRVGKLFVAVARQGAGAPIIDGAHTGAVDGWTGGSLAIRLPRTPGRALIVGWVGSSSPMWICRLARRRGLRWLFGSRR